MGSVTNWVAWHEAYDDPSSSLSARLRRVRTHLSDAIDRAPAGPPPAGPLFTFPA
jgi:hypothetical protein